MKLIICALAMLMSSCVVHGRREYIKQTEMWQSIGRMSGILECQQILLKQADERLKAAQEKNQFKGIAEKAAEKTKVK